VWITEIQCCSGVSDVSDERGAAGGAAVDEVGAGNVVGERKDGSKMSPWRKGTGNVC
jgi:hypothetical protein